ncbi:MAG: arsenate reductase (glutaredoxin) [Emcibacter sp.]|nr:arsenate reductase (glutaredoxin) [Emcibacter sp.]
MTVTIFHNPKCSKSRETLALIEKQGIKPTIIEYLKDIPTASMLSDILDKLDMEPRDLMRKKEVEYKENNLALDHLSREYLIQVMVDFPRLIERPIVLSNGKAAIGRPPENVLNIL